MGVFIMKLFKLIIISLSILIFIWIVYLFIIPNIKKEEIILPNFKDYSLTEAKTFLDNNDIHYEIIEYDYSDSVSIEKSLPEAYTTVKKGSYLKLYINMPINSNLLDYTNVLYSDVENLILDYVEAKNYKLIINYEVNNDLYEGIIISQEEVNNSLILSISKNEDFYIDNYVGLNILDVIDDIKEFNISLNYISSLIPFNIIIRQSISNKYIKYNNQSEIILYISKGI